jgi:hypothetical protein
MTLSRITSSMVSRSTLCCRTTSSFISSLLLAAAAMLFLLPLGGNLQAQVTVLHKFTGTGGDGYSPSAPVINGPDGTLYGTTYGGGDLQCPEGYGQGCGTVFQEKFSGGQWIYSTIFEFKGGKEGAHNESTLAIDSTGRLYGVTFGGSPGIIFRLKPGAPGQPWQARPLYEFKDQSDGEFPLTPLFIDNKGAVYGATTAGSLSSCPNGCGAIFQIVPPSQPGGAWTENTLYQFTGASDGGTPDTLIMDRSGVIYGTTTYDGAVNGECPSGCGVVFRLAPSQNGKWTYSVIYTFRGSPDGIPYGSLLKDASGNLYGLAHQILTGEEIFRLAPPQNQNGAWTRTIIYTPSDGVTSITAGTNGVLYGVYFGDQDFDAGNLFELTPKPGGGFSAELLVDFNNGPDSNPNGVVLGPPGALYGTLAGDLDQDGGDVFAVP